MRRIILLVLSMALSIAVRQANADYVVGTATNLGPAVNSSARDEEPGISSDGLSIYFCSLRSGGYGGYDMWVTTRATAQDDWGSPVNLGLPVNSSADDFSEDISADGLELYFGSNRSGSSGYDIWVAKRATMQDKWTTPVNLGTPVNSSSAELCSDVSPDGLSLILVSARAGGYGGSLGDLWLTKRSPTNSPWGQPVNLGPIVNSSSSENGPCLSAGGSMLYYSCDRAGGSGLMDMWQAPIVPVVDLNNDGIVDSADMCIVVDNWGTDNSLCDIGPVPWGDGMVDVQDLIVLAEHLFEEVPRRPGR